MRITVIRHLYQRVKLRLLLNKNIHDVGQISGCSYGLSPFPALQDWKQYVARSCFFVMLLITILRSLCSNSEISQLIATL